MESRNHFFGSGAKSLYNVPKHAKQPRRKKLQNYSHVFVCHRNVPDLYKCKNCNLKTNLKVSLTHHFNQNHKNLNKNPLKYMMRQCEYCDFKTYSILLLLKHYPKCDKSKNLGVGEMRQIIKWMECGQCTSRLPPTPTNDIKSECTNCELKSKTETESDLRRYSAIKDWRWFQCDKCEYKTKRKARLKQHSASIHPESDSTNIVWHHCDQCDFKTLWKINLKPHIANFHTDSSSTVWYRCDKCEYKAKRKTHLEHHKANNVHTDTANTVWYQCDKCEFKTTWRSSLKPHIANVHTDSANIIWHHCEKCEYKTRWKAQLQKHIVNIHHTDSLETVSYQCDKCDFQTVYKSNLKQHVTNIHTDFANIVWHQCEKCDYKTRWKTNFKRHMANNHTEIDKVVWVKCE